MQAYPTDRASLERDCTEAFFVASGPGGQNRNKVETGVRLIHRPSGLSVTATERRSQSANRERAFERMAERLEKWQHRPATRIPTRSTKAGRERRLQRKQRTSLIKQQRTTTFHQNE
jgi:protein subunit release factor B